MTPKCSYLEKNYFQLLHIQIFFLVWYSLLGNLSGGKTSKISLPIGHEHIIQMNLTLHPTQNLKTLGLFIFLTYMLLNLPIYIVHETSYSDL